MAGPPGADDVPSVTVAHAARVAAISKLGAIGVFFPVIQAACRQTIWKFGPMTV